MTRVEASAVVRLLELKSPQYIDFVKYFCHLFIANEERIKASAKASVDPDLRSAIDLESRKQGPFGERLQKEALRVQFSALADLKKDIADPTVKFKDLKQDDQIHFRVFSSPVDVKGITRKIVTEKYPVWEAQNIERKWRNFGYGER